jgi:hypothetical protein
MGAYIPFVIWLISAFICVYIAKNRNVKVTLVRQLMVVFLGPFAIPLVYFLKPEKNPE